MWWSVVPPPYPARRGASVCTQAEKQCRWQSPALVHHSQGFPQDEEESNDRSPDEEHPQWHQPLMQPCPCRHRLRSHAGWPGRGGGHHSDMRTCTHRRPTTWFQRCTSSALGQPHSRSYHTTHGSASIAAIWNPSPLPGRVGGINRVRASKSVSP